LGHHLSPRDAKAPGPGPPPSAQGQRVVPLPQPDGPRRDEHQRASATGPPVHARRPIGEANDAPNHHPRRGVSESSNTAVRWRTRATKGTDMATTTRVWISPQAHERLHRELDT